MYKFGCDPEFFATVNIDGKPFVISPAFLEMESGLTPIGGDLKHPVYILGDNYKWIMDGAAMELTIAPQENPLVLYKNIQIALEHLEEFLDKFSFRGEKIHLFKEPVVNIDPALYLPYINENEKLYQGFIFGCDPDKDAIIPDYVCKTIDVAKHLYRYGGGHIHFSGHKFLENENLTEIAIRYVAMTVGNYFIAHSPYPEKEMMRAKTYGQPGRYRHQKYPNGEFGLEYRTPSNSWVTNSDFFVGEMMEMLPTSMKFMEDQRIDLLEELLPPTIEAITNSDVELAKKILAYLN